MRPSTFFFACVLGLLATVSMAAQPIFSTVEAPFGLRTGRFPPNQFSVILKHQEDINAFVPVLSDTNRGLPSFKLVNGNLTTSDGSLGAFFGDSSSGDLIPLRFSDNVPVGVFVFTADFVVNTLFSPSAGSLPKLFSLNGDIVVKNLAEGEPLFVKPIGNNDTTQELFLDILDVAAYTKFGNVTFI